MPLTAGTRIGPYEIVGWLGAGGMGEVYRARDKRLDRDVAIKLIPETFAADRNRLARFEQEARAAGQLNHPNILAVYDVGTHAGAPYIVSELLEGESLGSRLTGGAISARKAVDYARQAAEGLAAAHDRGIIHRDLKPDNLFVTSDGRIKILDFGVAKLTRPSDDAVQPQSLPTQTDEGMVVGTPRYMSPEQVRGEPVDPRSDLFSFGAILYEMLGGAPAFSRPTAAETMTAILKDDPPPMLPAAAAPALERIVARCLEKTRDARFQSARDLAFALEVLSGTHPSAASVAARPKPRALWMAAGAAVVVLGAVAALAIWLTRDPTEAMDNRWARATITRITDSGASEWAGSEKDAAISSDGRFVAFVADRDGPFHVWRTQAGTGDFLDLTPGAPAQTNRGMSRSIGFSGDGSAIWIMANAGDPAGRLRLVPLIGGASHSFLNDKVQNVAWSRDGRKLAYFTAEPGDPISVADATGDNAREIFIGKKDDIREHNHFLAWSMDDAWIYYTHGTQAPLEYDVWRIRPAPGAVPERLTHTSSRVEYVTPIDDRWLLYVAPDADKSGPWLWALDVRQKIAHRLSTGLERYLSVASSADGRRLVATVASSEAGLWTVPILDRVAEEGDVKPYPLKANRASMPRFAGQASPALFYLSSSGSEERLFRFENGKVDEILTGADGPLSGPPAVSRDGRRLAVVLPHEGKQHLSIMSVDGADARVLAPSIDVRGTPDWSDGDQWIVTGGTDAEGSGLFKIRVDDGTSVRLVTGAAFDPVWSPDGTLIVYTGQETAMAPLRAVRPDKTPVTLPQIVVPFASGAHGRARFLPNGKGLVFMHGSTGSQEFWLLDLATSKTHAIARLPSSATILTFDIAPDGRQIVFDRVRENADIRLIDLK